MIQQEHSEQVSVQQPISSAQTSPTNHNISADSGWKRKRKTKKLQDEKQDNYIAEYADDYFEEDIPAAQIARIAEKLSKNSKNWIK